MEEKKPCIKILVACHKADPNIRQDDIYMPIQVGKALHPELDLGFQCDNTGDNISEKNASYCELTALYWAWKNLKDVDYIGLCHYRRYFDMDMTEDNITKMMNKYGAIILKPKVLNTNIVTELAYLTSIEDSYIFIDELLRILPEKKDLIYSYFYLNNKFTNCNMFIMSHHNFCEYCEFLFQVLGGVEARIKSNGYSRLKRVLGYLSEPLLGFWMVYKNMRFLEINKDQTFELNIVPPKQLPSWVDNIRANITFFIKYLPIKKKETNFFEEWILNGLHQDGIILYNE